VENRIRADEGASAARTQVAESYSGDVLLGARCTTFGDRPTEDSHDIRSTLTIDPWPSFDHER
jgi:hypothetical protein